MATTYGITPQGFVVKQQNTIIQEINAIIQAIWGPNVNLGPQSNFGQFAGIFSEREALIWQLLEAVYNSNYPGGAEGTSVDNILALTNLRRLPATPTITDSTVDIQTANDVAGVELYGLLMWGTPGIVIPQLSVIQTSGAPVLNFQTQADYTIGSIVNAVQVLYLSNAPDSGAFELTFYDPATEALVTASMPFNSIAAQTVFVMTGTPSSSSHFAIQLGLVGAQFPTANISTNAAFPTAAAVQTAITAISGYSGVTVARTGSGPYIYTITWGSIPNPTITMINDTTGSAFTIRDSIQANVNNLFDSTNNYYPLSDLIVTGTIASQAVTFTFGGGTVATKYPSQPTDNPSCAGQQQALFRVTTNSLYASATATNTQVTQTVMGSGVWGTGAALSTIQGLGTNYGTVSGVANCVSTGPNFVADGALSVIGSPTSGWQGVVNQLVCVTGADLETDTNALIRRAELLAENAKTPLAAIIDVVTTLVEPVNGKVVGFENTTQAALQTLTFSAAPASGLFQLGVGTQVTGNISTFTPAAVQTAIRLLTGYDQVLVTGSIASGANYGLTIDFNGSEGGQRQNLVTVPVNTTGDTITPAFSRPGSSFEIVVGDQGSITDTQIAQTIEGNKAAGIKAYGTVNTVVYDKYLNAYQIGFSTPTGINFYVVVSLTTDYYNTIGSPGSGVNPNAKFVPGSVATILQDILDIGNSFGIGARDTAGEVVGFGSNGLIGAFNSVPGIISYTLFFGTAPAPGTNTNVPLLAEQQALFTSLNTSISWT